MMLERTGSLGMDVVFDEFVSELLVTVALEKVCDNALRLR